ncbi:MAG: septum formation initiator family protein [Dehalococcoidia bacterium]|nr:septum formation initiator family protein [Dehalococcoidia bacterium]
MALLHRTALPAPRLLGRRISARAVLIAVAVVVVAVAALQVNQFSRAASTGYTIDALTRQRAAKQAENYELEAQVARLSSLSRVESDARTKLGLVPATRTIYVTVNQPLPSGPSLPARFQEQAAAAAANLPPPPPAPSLWKRLLQLLPFY